MEFSGQLHASVLPSWKYLPVPIELDARWELARSKLFGAEKNRLPAVDLRSSSQQPIFRDSVLRT